VAIIGVLAAVAIPAYQEYVNKSHAVAAYQAGRDAAAKVGSYYMAKGETPANLAQAGVQVAPDAAVADMRFNPDDGRLEVMTHIAGAEGYGTLVFKPSLDDNKRVVWHCSAENLKPGMAPPGCR